MKQFEAMILRSFSLKPTELEEELFSVDSYGMLPERVARRFAETHFGEPRQVEYFTNDCKFGLVDGNIIYQVKFVRGDYKKTADTYKVFKF